MKTLKELEEIRQRTLESVNLRKDRKGARVVVGMATCGISAGARPVLMAFVEEIQNRRLLDANRYTNRMYWRMPFRANGRSLYAW